MSARARTLARSTPRLTRPFSMAEIVDCGRPDLSDSWGLEDRLRALPRLGGGAGVAVRAEVPADS